MFMFPLSASITSPSVFNRFPWFIPTLEPEFVADSVVDAMLKNQGFLLTPRILWLFYWLKPFLPFHAQMALGDFLGITTFMDKFTGHGGTTTTATKLDGKKSE